MQAYKRIIFFCVLVFMSTICNCCDILNYSSLCVDEQMSITVSFEHLFNGTIFANGHIGNPDGYIGNPNCSSENMETTSSYEVTFNLSFMDCNTRIKRGKSHLQAINTVTIQYHPLIKSDLDCQITVECDIDYHLSSDFLTSYLRLDLVPSVKSKLDIMSGEKLFGPNISSRVGGKQFLVLNVTDEGKYDHLRIRKCYAHAKNVIVSAPDLLLEDNICSNEGFLDSLYLKYLKVDKSYSDLRDFSEVQNFDVSFSQKQFYITCAFDLCSDPCSNFCIGETEVNKKHWSTVRTHQVEVLDESFKGFRNRQNDLRKSIKILYSRLLKLKNKQNALNNSIDSRTEMPKLGETVQVANDDVSVISVESNSTAREESNKQIQFVKDSRISDIEASEDESLLSRDANEIAPENIINSNLNISDGKADEHFLRRSDVTGTIDRRYRMLKSAESDATGDSLEEAVSIVINADSTKHFDTPGNLSMNSVDSSEVISGESNQSEKPLSECLHTWCSDKSFDIPGREEDGGKSDISNDSFNNSEKVRGRENSMNSNDSFDDVRGSSIFNLTASNDAEKDCVPYLKFAAVTASLSLLCISFFLITLFLSLYIRKEKKRRNNVSYLYRHF